MTYDEFIKRKSLRVKDYGIEPENLNYPLFEFQRAIIKWALKKGRCAVWADCGLGKTRISLVWANEILKKENKPIIILTPLAVAHQFKKEGLQIGVDVNICKEEKDLKPGINCINYQRLHKLDPSQFVAVVADESSILKDYSSATRNQLIDSFCQTKYRLALTATPAPNDVMELGNHSHFLSTMTRNEMLSMYFVHDGGETQKWRLKKHARSDFWKWASMWAIAARHPKDIRFDEQGFDLPKLNIDHHTVESDHIDAQNQDGTLFFLDAKTLSEQRQARRDSLSKRIDKAKEIIDKKPDESWIIWCDMNIESEIANKVLSACEIRGSQTIEQKEEILIGFTDEKIKRIVTKPSICGHGMNWQHCSNVIFLGVSHSFEQWYQAIRRVYRFGQKNDVNCHIITSDREINVLTNLERKQKESIIMIEEISKHAKI